MKVFLSIIFCFFSLALKSMEVHNNTIQPRRTGILRSRHDQLKNTPLHTEIRYVYIEDLLSRNSSILDANKPRSPIRVRTGNNTLTSSNQKK